jgi:hypothetical protein
MSLMLLFCYVIFLTDLPIFTVNLYLLYLFVFVCSVFTLCNGSRSQWLAKIVEVLLIFFSLFPPLRFMPFHEVRLCIYLGFLFVRGGIRVVEKKPLSSHASARTCKIYIACLISFRSYKTTGICVFFEFSNRYKKSVKHKSRS